MIINNKRNQYILSNMLSSEVNFNILFSSFNSVVNIDKDITIICTINNEDSFFHKQTLKGNSVIYTSYNELLQTLNTVKTKFCLILNGLDAFICNDLDQTFLNKFESLSLDYIFSGMSFAYNDLTLFNYRNLLIKGFNKFLNSAICFGYTSKILELYSNLITDNIEIDFNYEINELEYQFIQMQLKIENYLINKNKYNIDTNNDFFSTLFDSTFSIKEENNNLYLEVLNYNTVNIFDIV